MDNGIVSQNPYALLVTEALLCEPVDEDIPGELARQAEISVRLAGLDWMPILPLNPVLWPEALRRLKLGWRYSQRIKVFSPPTIYGFYWAESLPDQPPPKGGYQWHGRR
jgi:hypothetical protein